MPASLGGKQSLFALSAAGAGHCVLLRENPPPATDHKLHYWKLLGRNQNHAIFSADFTYHGPPLQLWYSVLSLCHFWVPLSWWYLWSPSPPGEMQQMRGGVGISLGRQLWSWPQGLCALVHIINVSATSPYLQMSMSWLLDKRLGQLEQRLSFVSGSVGAGRNPNF